MERGRDGKSRITDEAERAGFDGWEQMRLYLQKKFRIITGDESVTVEALRRNFRYEFSFSFSPELLTEYSTLLSGGGPYNSPENIEKRAKLGQTRIWLGEKSIADVFGQLDKKDISFEFDQYDKKLLLHMSVSVDAGDANVMRDWQMALLAEEAERVDQEIFKKAISEAIRSKS